MQLLRLLQQRTNEQQQLATSHKTSGRVLPYNGRATGVELVREAEFVFEHTTTN